MLHRPREALGRWPLLAAIMAAFGLALGVANATWGETVKMSRVALESGQPAAAAYWQSASPQYLSIPLSDDANIRVPSRPNQPETPPFDEVVSKEPKYLAAQPVKAVFRLGDVNFGCAFDFVPPDEEDDKDAKKNQDAKEEADAEKPSDADSAPRFNRLYFDLNGNGDLTDDIPIDTTPAPVLAPPNYSVMTFPEITVSTKVDGESFEYPCQVRGTVYQYRSGADAAYMANVMLRGAAVVEGTVTIEGKSHKIVVADGNSNGRFDDLMEVTDEIRLASGGYYAFPGDWVFVDPDATDTPQAAPVAKILQIDETFYDLDIAPSGSELSLAPSDVEIGYVARPNTTFECTMFSELGFVQLASAGERAAMPAGEWRLYSYTITAEVETDDSEENALSAVMSMLQRRRGTQISARGTREQDPIKIAKGETSELPFGEPYSCKVEVHAEIFPGQVLPMSLEMTDKIGSSVYSLYVNGSRPPKPTFTIADDKGNEVASGDFEYG